MLYAVQLGGQRPCKRGSGIFVGLFFLWRGGGTVLPNGVKVAVSDNSQKCQKLTNMGLTSDLQLFLMYFI